MCRLLGYATDGRNISLNQAIGVPGVKAFRELSLIHNDGWGSAMLAAIERQPYEQRPYVSDGGAPSPETGIRLYRSTVSARLDPTFSALAGQAARGGLFHLRLASSNLPLVMENQQPFYAQGLSFIHNGDISDEHGVNLVANYNFPVNREILSSTAGGSDSAIFFAVILEELLGGVGLPAAVARAVRRLRQGYPKSSYNCMVQDANQLVCLRASGRVATSPRIVEAYQRYHRATLARNYRALWYKPLHAEVQGADGVVIASSGIGQSEEEGWRELDNDQMLVASNRTGEFSVRDL